MSKETIDDNREIFPTRKGTRLASYDYSMRGAYFITVCVQDRKQVFWDKNVASEVGADIIRPNNVPLSRFGRILERAIISIPEYYPSISVDQYVIMPEHFHAILFFDEGDGRIISAPTLSRVVGQLKRIVSKQIGCSVWQKSFFDHIIRDNDDYIKHKNYILDNPRKRILQDNCDDQ